MAAGINDTFRQVGIAVGIAAWGAIFLGAGASKTQEVAGSAVHGDEARQLVEATSSGALPQAVSHLPQQAQGKVAVGGRTGLPRTASTTILLLGALLSFAGAVAALWMVRERDIEREGVVEGAPLEAEPEPVSA